MKPLPGLPERAMDIDGANAVREIIYSGVYHHATHILRLRNRRNSATSHGIKANRSQSTFPARTQVDTLSSLLVLANRTRHT